MEKQIKMSLETARELAKVCADNEGAPFGSLSKVLLENFTLEELKSSPDVFNMFACWRRFLDDFGMERGPKLPWTKEECENDDSKANDVAYHMVKEIVAKANKDVPKTDKYWIPYFDNSGFYRGTRGWYHHDGYCSVVSFRLRYNNQELCERYVKKYEPIYKVYQYQ